MKNASMKRVTGPEMRKLILSDTGFDIDGYGGITLTGERASDSILWPYDDGHNFRLLRGPHYKADRWEHLSNPKLSDSPTYWGPLLLDLVTPITLPTLPTWDGTGENTQHYQRANRALVRLAPMAPQAGLARMLGELRNDGLPSITGLALARTQMTGRALTSSVASEYLNYTFALKPTISDLGKLVTTVKSVERIISRYQEMVQNERVKVHSSARLLKEESVPTCQDTAIYMAVQNAPVSGYTDSRVCFSKFFEKKSSSITTWSNTAGTVTDLVKRNVWLECEFAIYLEDLLAFLNNTKSLRGKLAAVLDTKVSIQTVYDLTPWTWLVGWFSDLSSIIGRAEYFANDAVVLRYGYIMHEYQVSRTLCATAPYRLLKTGSLYWPTPMVVEWTSKSRWRATPYGFGLNIVDFSPARWGILAALGFTRAPGQLHYRE